MTAEETRTATTIDTPQRAHSSAALAAWRALDLFVSSVVLLFLWLSTAVLDSTDASRKRRAVRWTHRWARACCRAAGFTVSTHGRLPGDGALLAPNHQGYADVLALGAVVPCFFVAKVDVESWPFIGLLFRTSRNIGVPRSRVKALARVTEDVADRLRNGQSVCVFLEGTSTGGDFLRPFYPPLAQPAIDAGAPVVPISIRWSARDGRVSVAEDIAYWKDHVFGPHAWRLLGLRGVHAEITFGEPIAPAEHTRKTLAAAAETAVVQLTGLPVESSSQRPV